MSKAVKNSNKTRTKKSSSWAPFDYVLFRHTLPAKHRNYELVFDMVESPFESGSSTETTGSISAPDAYVTPRGRWLVLGAWTNLSWFTIDSSELDSRGRLEQVSNSRRLESLSLTGDKDGNLSICFVRARKVVLEGVGNASDPDWSMFTCSDDQLKETVGQCSTVQEAFEALCDYFDLKLPLPVVRENDGKFEMLGRRGKPVKSGMTAYKLCQGSGIAAGANDAADLMDKALDDCDPDQLTRAIEAGAPLEQLPESSLSPLLSALFKFDRQPNWKTCAQMLIDAGCEVNGEDNTTPPIISCTENFVPPEMAKELIKFLIENGADVDREGQNGKTALLNAAFHRWKGVVKILLKAGADPNHMSPYGDGETIVDSIRSRFEKDLKHQSRSAFAPILELLAGKAPDQPQLETLSPELVAENKRFTQVEQARGLSGVEQLNLKIKKMKVCRLAKYRETPQIHSALLQLGFEPASHFSTNPGHSMHSSYTDPTRNFDAVVCDGGVLSDGELRVEIGAYHPDGTVTFAYNKPVMDEGNVESRVFIRHVFEGSDPIRLVSELESLTQDKQLVSIDAETFDERFADMVQRYLDDFSSHAKEMRDDLLHLPDGSLPRFERLGIYLSTWDPEKHPDYSSRKLMSSRLNDLNETPDLDDDWQLESPVRDAAFLCLMRHLQYAGAPENVKFLQTGIERVMALSDLMTRKPAKFRNRDVVDDLAFSTVLLLLDDRWEDFETTCNHIKPSLANSKHWFEGCKPVALAEVQLLIASAHRDKKIQGASKLPAKIRSGRCQQARHLLNMLEAIEIQDDAEFGKALIKSLKHTAKTLKKKNSPDGPFGKPTGNVYEQAAWLESGLAMIAIHNGMEIPELPDRLSDWLITRKTVGC